MDTEKHVFGITRPHPKLMTLYVVRAILALPMAPVLLPYLYFRYHTLRYRFDQEGISMSWGILFRREIHLTYTRIQDIHLSSGFLQRLLGLADIQVQTASGSSAAEMTIEGLLEHELVRDYLYRRMRGLKEAPRVAGAAAAAASAEASEGDAVALLREIAADVRAARVALERR